MADRVFLDTVIFIDLLEGQGDRYAILAPLVKRAEMGIVEFAVSEVTVAEVCRLDSENNITTETVDGFLSNTYCRRFPVTPDISEKAAELIRTYSLETCDAIILATALERRGHILYTRDGSLRKRIRSTQQLPKEIGTSIAGMKLRAPYYDEDLCSVANIPVGGPQKADDDGEQEADGSEAGPQTGDTSGGGGGLGSGDGARSEQTETRGGMAEGR